MGVVGRPIKDRGFDGRIHMERVSKTVKVKKMTAHQIFCDDVIINQQIKQRSWRDLDYEGCTVEATKDRMQE